MKSHSQFGEDLILLDFFNKTKLNKGFFFEFGYGMEFFFQIVDCFMNKVGKAVLLKLTKKF